MICGPCKYAGKQLQFVTENPALIELVREAHAQCPDVKRQERIKHEEQHGLTAQRLNAMARATGQLCDCQHEFRESALNKALLTTLQVADKL